MVKLIQIKICKQYISPHSWIKKHVKIIWTENPKVKVKYIVGIRGKKYCGHARGTQIRMNVNLIWREGPFEEGFPHNYALIDIHEWVHTFIRQWGINRTWKLPSCSKKTKAEIEEDFVEGFQRILCRGSYTLNLG